MSPMDGIIARPPRALSSSGSGASLRKSAQKLAKKTYWLRTADAETTTERQQLHRLTLREIQRPDSLSPDVPVALKKLIATHLARSARGPAETNKRVTHPGDGTSFAAATTYLPAPHGCPKRSLN